VFYFLFPLIFVFLILEATLKLWHSQRQTFGWGLISESVVKLSITHFIPKKNNMMMHKQNLFQNIVIFSLNM